MPHAATMARAFHKQAPFYSVDEHQSAAYRGLVTAGLRYKKKRRVPFWAFAVRHVRGAMRDNIGWHGFTRPLPLDAYRRASLTGKLEFKGFHRSPTLQPPSDSLAFVDLHEAISMLDERLARIVHMYFFEGWTCKAISVAEGVNESRISQLLKRARGLLREELELRGISAAKDCV